MFREKIYQCFQKMAAFPIKKQSIKNGESTYQNDHRLNNSLIMNKYQRKLESGNSVGEFYRDADGNWRLKPSNKRRIKY